MLPMRDSFSASLETCALGFGALQGASAVVSPPAAPPSKDRATQDRAVHSELRQSLNADRRRRFGDSGRPLALVCECGNSTCHRTVLMTPKQYDAQPGPILYPGHAPTHH